MALDAESGVRMITEASRLPTSPLRRRAGTLVGSILLLVLAVLSGGSRAEAFDPAATARFARLALDCVGREYPNKITHELRGDGDIAPPRRLYPAFHGCFDWHSSVHGHWLLVRLLRTQADAPYAEEARAALERNLTVANIEGELTTLGRGSETFERPYGLAWLLQLGADLRQWNDPDARRWLAALEPLEREAGARLQRWLPKLTMPIRTGEHSQTAFAFGLALDAARVSGDRALEQALVARVQAFHADDRDCPIAYEPSGQDFLSPCLAEADLMRRVLAAHEFARWLGRFLPGIPRRARDDWLVPGVVLDAGDGKLAHLHGLNLSRAWMLDGIADALPSRDRRIDALRAAARHHADIALAAVNDADYAGSHWLGSFATYLVTRRPP